MNIKEIFDEVSNQMSSELKLSRTSLNHPTMKGDVAETIFRSFLRKYLPNNLDISTGILVDTEGNSSKQLDVIISDTAKTPIFFENSNHRIIPIECAYAVMEVKTKLNKNELEKSFKNMKSIRKLKKTAYFCQPGPIEYSHNMYGKKWDIWPVNYYLFAYESINIETLIKMVESTHNEQKLPPHSRIDSICILNEGVICNSNVNNELYALPDLKSELVYTKNDNSLLLFYTLIMHFLNQARLPIFNFNNYVETIFEKKHEE